MQTQLEIKLHEALEKLVDPSVLPTIVDTILKVLPKERAMLVTDFHTAFSHPINNVPTFDKGRHVNRQKYLAEEISEIGDALVNDSHVDLVDTYIDILYFAYGGLVEAGVAHKTQELFEEVHRANMSKLCSNALTLEQTKNTYIAKEIEVYTEESPLKGYFIVKRKDDHKILKSIHFTEPQLEPIINK